MYTGRQYVHHKEQPVEITTSTENGRVPITVMHVHGNIDSTTYESFTTYTKQLIQSGSQYILIDLSNSPFISSAGLRTLHGIFKQLNALYPDPNLSESEIKKRLSLGTYKSPYLKLLNLSRETQTAFTLSGFDLFIETFTDKEKALASFQA
jgi:anti-anti-sigma factor